MPAIWRPKPADPSKTPIVWVSDNNPARTDQIAQFNLEHPEANLWLDYASVTTTEWAIRNSLKVLMAAGG